MKKIACQKSVPRIIAALLALTLLIAPAALSACNRGEGDVSSDAPGETTEVIAAEQPMTIFADGKSKFTVIRSSRAEGDEFKASSILTRELSKYTGLEFEAVDDVLAPESADSYEILVGATNREISSSAVKGLRTKDYVIGIYGNKIVLAGTTPEMTFQAVNVFIDTVLLPQVVGKDFVSIIMQPEDSKVHVYSGYSVTDCNILGTPLEEYSIVYPSDGLFSAKRTAILLSNYLADTAGFILPVISDKANSTGHEIRIGKTSRGGVELSGASLGAWQGTVADGALCFGAENLFGYMNLYTYLSKTLFTGGNVEIGADYTASGDGSTEPEAKYSEEKYGEYRAIFFNILGNCDTSVVPTPQRNQTAAEVLTVLKPDVIGLQECSANSRGSSSVVPTLAKYSYAEVAVTVTNSNKINYTPLFYNKDRLKVIDSGYHPYSDGANDKSKSITWAVFEDISNGKRFAVCSTHFYYKAEAEAARILDAEQLLEVNRSIVQKYNCPVISGGDLNCKYPTTPFQNLLKGGMLAFQKIAEKTEDSKTSHLYPEWDESAGLYLKLNAPKGDYNGAIDHALVYNGDKLTARLFDVIKLQYALISSDHCPVMVDFDIAG